MREDMECILLTEEQISQRVRELGEQISRDFEGREPLFVGVLKGCFVFMSDLVREVSLRCGVDFMVVSSYGSGTTTSGNVKIRKDLDTDVSGRHVLILEDILDSGVTLHTLTRMLKGRGALSVKICTLLDKPSGRRIEIAPDYSCFTIPGGFVVGFGLDYDEHYRNLPFIGILKPEVYAT